MTEFVRKHWLVLMLLVIVMYIMVRLYEAATTTTTYLLKGLGAVLLVGAAIVKVPEVAPALLVAGGLSLLNDVFSWIPGLNWIGYIAGQINGSGNSQIVTPTTANSYSPTIGSSPTG